MPQQAKPLHNIAMRTMYAGGTVMAIIFSALFMLYSLQSEQELQHPKVQVKLDYISALVGPLVMNNQPERINQLVEVLRTTDKDLHAIAVKNP